MGGYTYNIGQKETKLTSGKAKEEKKVFAFAFPALTFTPAPLPSQSSGEVEWSEKSTNSTFSLQIGLD